MRQILCSFTMVLPCLLLTLTQRSTTLKMSTMKSFSPVQVFAACLFLLSISARADRGLWLCNLVDQAASQHRDRNVIGFLQGSYTFQDISNVTYVEYQEGRESVTCAKGANGDVCSTATGRAVSTATHLFAPGASGSVLANFFGGLGADIALSNTCLKFKLVEFANGTFERYGPGGYDNWCFSGEHGPPLAHIPKY